MGGKNRAIEGGPEEEVPQKSNLKTRDITVLLHLHLLEKAESARALRDKKIKEHNDLIDRVHSSTIEINKQNIQLAKELTEFYKKLSELDFLQKIPIIEERKKIEEERKQLHIKNNKFLEEKRIINEKINASIKEYENFIEETKKIDDIPLYEDRLISLEKLTKQETELIEKRISLHKELNNKKLEKEIEINKEINGLINKKIKLMEKEIELYKKEEEKFSGINSCTKKIEAIEKSILIWEEEKAQSAQKNPPKIEEEKVRTAPKNTPKIDVFSYEKKVLNLIEEILYLKVPASYQSTGLTTMRMIIGCSKVGNIRDTAQTTLNKLIDCAEKRLGFFQSWYSQSSFFGGGRKDWVHELYITLKCARTATKKYNSLYSWQKNDVLHPMKEMINHLENIKNKAIEQKINDNHISSWLHNGR